jgi:flagellar hook-associated protein 1 FlgK
MSLEAALGIAQSGLTAVQRSLTLVSQNISNANTDGYTRKTLAPTAVSTGVGPDGVRTGDAQRAVDQALVAKLDQSQSAVAATTTRESALQGIETAHGTTDAGTTIADGITALLNGFTTLASNPADTGQQQATLQAATILAQRLNGVSAAIGAARQDAQNGIVADVATANAALRSIAALTNQLRNGSATDPASLEDQRDAAIAQLSKTIAVAAVKKPGGDLLLIANGGLVLPLDPNKDAFTTTGATTNPTNFHGGTGNLPTIMLNGRDVTGQLSGGTLAENIRLRDSTLPRYQAEIDLTAATLAHRMDAEGLTLFTDSDGASVPDTSQPYAGSSQVGFAGRIEVNPAITANAALLRDGTHSVAATAGGPSAFTQNPTGGPVSFATLIDRIRNFALGANADTGVPWPDIATGGLGPDGSLSSPFTAPVVIGDYASRVTTAQVGDRAAATAAKTSATTLRDSLQARFKQASGVDTDKEMAAMVALQNAYAANARVMTTIQTMWDSLLAVAP